MKKYISLILGSQIRIINLVRLELHCQECQLQYSIYNTIHIHSETLVLLFYLTLVYTGVYTINYCNVIINYEHARTTHRRIITRLTVNQWIFPFQYGWHQIERFLSCCLVPNSSMCSRWNWSYFCYGSDIPHQQVSCSCLIAIGCNLHVWLADLSCERVHAL